MHHLGYTVFLEIDCVKERGREHLMEMDRDTQAEAAALRGARTRRWLAWVIVTRAGRDWNLERGR